MTIFKLKLEISYSFFVVVHCCYCCLTFLDLVTLYYWTQYSVSTKKKKDSNLSIKSHFSICFPLFSTYSLRLIWWRPSRHGNNYSNFCLICSQISIKFPTLKTPEEEETKIYNFTISCNMYWFSPEFRGPLKSGFCI